LPLAPTWENALTRRPIPCKLGQQGQRQRARDLYSTDAIAATRLGEDKVRDFGIRQILMPFITVLLGILVGLSICVASVSAHDYTWRIDTPDKVAVNDASPLKDWIVAEAASNFRNVSKVKMQYGPNPDAFQVDFVYGNPLVMGINSGFAEVWKHSWLTGWHRCFEIFGTSNHCIEDTVVYARIFINEQGFIYRKLNGSSQMQRYLATHELGHVPGLKDIPCPPTNSSIMSDCFDPSAFYLTLQSHDVADLNSMYP